MASIRPINGESTSFPSNTPTCTSSGIFNPVSGLGIGVTGVKRGAGKFCQTGKSGSYVGVRRRGVCVKAGVWVGVGLGVAGVGPGAVNGKLLQAASSRHEAVTSHLAGLKPASCFLKIHVFIERLLSMPGSNEPIGL